MEEPCSGNHKKLYESGNHAYYATQNLITAAGVTRPPLFPVKLFLNCWRPFLINFTTKSYLHNETQIAYKFYTLYLLQLFLGGNFCSSVENVISVRDPFFLHVKSGCRSTLLKIHHPMSYLSKKTYCSSN